MAVPEHELTLILGDVASGVPGAKDRLLGAVHETLVHMAKVRVARERPGNSIRTLDLVNEAYLKLLGDETPRYESRKHFLGAAARAMWQILIDHQRRAHKQRVRVSLGEVELPSRLRALDRDRLLDLEAALTKLEQLDPRAADVVQLRLILDMRVPEVAEALGVSRRTVERDWRQAKGRIWRWLEADGDEDV